MSVFSPRELHESSVSIIVPSYIDNPVIHNPYTGSTMLSAARVINGGKLKLRIVCEFSQNSYNFASYLQSLKGVIEDL